MVQLGTLWTLVPCWDCPSVAPSVSFFLLHLCTSFVNNFDQFTAVNLEDQDYVCGVNFSAPCKEPRFVASERLESGVGIAAISPNFPDSQATYNKVTLLEMALNDPGFQNKYNQ